MIKHKNLRLILLLTSILTHIENFSNITTRKELRPRVSIITSVYNGDLFIEEFLKDITRQTIFEQCELIIINANSPGNEEPIIKTYLKKYPNIVYKKLDADPGLYAVWNIAIKMAKASLITNSNIDDRRRKSSLEMHAKFLENNSEIDLVYSDFYATTKPNETFEKNSHHEIIRYPDFSRFHMRMCLPGPFPMWRKNIHEKYGYFDEKYRFSGDWEMWLRAATNGARFKRVPGITGLFYVNPKGLTSDQEKSTLRNIEDAQIVSIYRYLWLRRK